jgi:hypothetical protein
LNVPHFEAGACQRFRGKPSLAPLGSLGSHYAKLAFDPARDFAPISQLLAMGSIVAESGFPVFEAVSWFGLFAPAGTPPAAAVRNDIAKWSKVTKEAGISAAN